MFELCHSFSREVTDTALVIVWIFQKLAGHPAEWITAIATICIAAVAWVQIAAARRENRLTQTLIACGLYDTSPVIFGCCQTLSKAKEDGRLEADPKSFQLEILTVLNFLDGIAIGVSQHMYVKELVKEHMSAIMKRQVRDLLESPVGKASGCTHEHFSRLVALNNEWSRDS